MVPRHSEMERRSSPRTPPIVTTALFSHFRPPAALVGARQVFAHSHFVREVGLDVAAYNNGRRAMSYPLRYEVGMPRQTRFVAGSNIDTHL
jgi:hypothetical protein